jgi:hypothetical protein
MTVRIDGDEDEGTWSLVNDNKIQLSATDITDKIILDINPHCSKKPFNY